MAQTEPDSGLIGKCTGRLRYIKVDTIAMDIAAVPLRRLCKKGDGMATLCSQLKMNLHSTHEMPAYLMFLEMRL